MYFGHDKTRWIVKSPVMFASLSLQLVILVLWTRIPFLGILSSKGSFQDSFSKRSSRSFPVAFWLWSWSVPSCWSYQFLPYTSQPINQSYNQTFLSTKRWEFISTIDLSHILLISIFGTKWSYERFIGNETCLTIRLTLVAELCFLDIVKKNV